MLLPDPPAALRPVETVVPTPIRPQDAAKPVRDFDTIAREALDVYRQIGEREYRRKILGAELDALYQRAHALNMEAASVAASTKGAPK